MIDLHCHLLPGLDDGAPDLADAVRAAAGVELAAVIEVSGLPLDRRHNSKIDRTRVATWADVQLSGRRPSPLRWRRP